MDKTYSTVVEGMTCGNCAITISKLLEKKGASNISANAASGDVSFTIVEDSEVKEVYDDIDDLGYRVVRDEDADETTHAHNHSSSSRTRLYLIICVILTVPLLMHMFVSCHVLNNPWVQLVLSTPVYITGFNRIW